MTRGRECRGISWLATTGDPDHHQVVRVSSCRCSGVGLAAVVGGVALAGAPLARALAHGVLQTEWVGVVGPRPRDDDHLPTARGPERPAAEPYPTHGKETVGFRTRYGSKFHFLAKIVPADGLIPPAGPPLCDAESATPKPAAPITPSCPWDPRGATERNRNEGNHQDFRGHALQTSHPDVDLDPGARWSGVAVGLGRLSRTRTAPCLSLHRSIP